MARSSELLTLIKGFSVIKAFNAEHPKLTLSEVARATGLTRAAARRVLLTLRSLGYVSSDERYFRLEPRILELGCSYLSTQPWWQVAQFTAERLAERLDTPVGVGVIDQDSVIYLAHGRPKRFEAFARSIGTRLPIDVSAIGRVLLAQLPDDELTIRLDHITLVQLTKTTIMDRAALRDAIIDARNNGYGLIDQELEMGLRSLAVPIFGRNGKVLAAIGISSSELDLNRQAFIDKFLPGLKRGAAEISDGLPS